MSYRDALPAWLRNAYTESNIISVLRTLSERESRREYVRLLSRSRAEVLSGFSSGLEASHFPVVVPDSYLEYYSVATANQMQNIATPTLYHMIAHGLLWVATAPQGDTSMLIGCWSGADISGG